jgi:hypothetical protein
MPKRKGGKHMASHSFLSGSTGVPGRRMGSVSIKMTIQWGIGHIFVAWK